MQWKNSSNQILGGGVLALYAAIALFHMASAAAGYSHYRDIHLGAALEFAKGRVDILRPVIVGFNATGSPTPQELPVWQALAGLLFKVFGTWFGWANLLSLVLFATGLWPLFQVAKEYVGDRCAWWTLIFFLAQPLVVFVSGQASADGLSLVLAIWFFFFAERLVRTGSLFWLAPAIVFGSLSAVTKLPLFMASGIASFLLLLFGHRFSLRRWVLLAGVGAASAGMFFAWTHYTDQVIASSEFPLVDLRLSTNPEMWRWYFGDWSYRLKLFNWAKAGWMALNSLFGSFALVGLVGWALFRSQNRLGQFWMVAAIIVTLIFSHLVLVHRHYYTLYSPSIALLMASAAVRGEKLTRLHTFPAKAWTALVISAAMLLSTVQGLIGMEVVLDYDPYPKRIATLIQEHTDLQDRLIIWNGGWGGEQFILSQRRGLSVQNLGLLDDAATYQRLKQLGYNKLVMISDSPLLTALQTTNPGNAAFERPIYESALTPVARELPTIFQNNDILVKELR